MMQYIKSIYKRMKSGWALLDLYLVIDKALPEGEGGHQVDTESANTIKSVIKQ